MAQKTYSTSKRFALALTDTEFRLLAQSAATDCRTPKDQARFLLRNALGLANSGVAQPGRAAQNCQCNGAGANHAVPTK